LTLLEYHEGHDEDCEPLCGEECYNEWECLHADGVFGMDANIDCPKCLKIMKESYDKTELYVFVNDIRRTADLIDAKLKRDKPVKGTWAELETKLNDLASNVYQALLDLDGDQ
jgi:hypothetical protein